jgi:hypothetical protein
MDINQIMALAATLFKSGTELYAFVMQERERLQQTGEWTAEQEAAWDVLQAQRAGQAWQKPTGS